MNLRFDELLPELVRGEIDFILVGGVAGNLHGAARLTYDVDIVYNRGRANLDRMVRVLAPMHPYLRGAPAGLPFRLDLPTLRNGLNFTLTTRMGDLDLLGEVPGGGTYRELLPRSMEITAFGVAFRCVDLPTLIRLKRAAGRPKDLESLAELEALLEECDRA